MKGNTVTTDSLILKNRLLKNQKKLKSYINKGNLEAYRLYNKDIPEYPYLIDIYGKHAVIYEQGKNFRMKISQERITSKRYRNSARRSLSNPPFTSAFQNP